MRIGPVGREWGVVGKGPDRSQGGVTDRVDLVLTHGPRLAGLTGSFELRELFVNTTKRQALFDLRNLDFKFLPKDRVDCWLLHDFS